ncbi:MAG: hypothetical protein GY765_02635 [bacterium]|nr:hypothetical protein [bacterium]
MKKLNLKEMKNLKGGFEDFINPCHYDLRGCREDTCEIAVVCLGVTLGKFTMSLDEYLEF